MQQPQIDIRPYSEKSIVIRTDPERFLEKYGGHLIPYYCKWNGNLKDATGQVTLGGWICSKKYEQSVLNVIDKIISGQLQPLTAKEYYANKQSSNMRPVLNTQSVSNDNNYQNIIIKVLRPHVGQNLKLIINNQVINVVVESVQNNNGIIDSAIIQLPDGQKTEIRLNTINAIWYIPGYDQSHEIKL